MLWASAMSAAVLHVAVLELPLPTSATPAQPLIAVPPSAKVTGPVGPEPVTVAVKLTVARATDGLAELTTPVVLKFLFTTCESPALIDPLLERSPAYVATMLRVPAGIALVGQVAILELALPAGSETAPQPVMVVPPSVKATGPVGAVPVTVAVKVTLLPTREGLTELASVVVVGGGLPMATERVSEPADPVTTLVTLSAIPYWLSM